MKSASRLIDPVIYRVTTLDLKFEPFAWPFARERRAEINAHFADEQREKPRMWNGRVLLGRQPAFTEGLFSASYFDTDFASLLAWRDWGFPDKSVFNGFGMGALRSADGAFVMGRMGAHTANAGRVYFPAGTPDLNDVAGRAVDIAGSVMREVEEETGLTPADYRAVAHWDCVVADASVAMMRTLHVEAAGEAVKARIEQNLARQAHPELAAIHLVRAASDLTADMPRFVTAFVERELTRGAT
jgi:8-oxo-dGTP pyrophosphatase MutT (NUDIX family)